MCEALKTLMKPEIDAEKDKSLTEGIALGRTEGIALGRTELGTAILRLNSGESMEALLADGLSEDTIMYAKELLDEI